MLLQKLWTFLMRKKFKIKEILASSSEVYQTLPQWEPLKIPDIHNQDIPMEEEKF